MTPRIFLIVSMLSTLMSCAIFTPHVNHDDSPEQGVATVEWTFAPDEAIYGFYVFRADRYEGPYQQVNGQIVLTIDPKSGREPLYSYEDATVVPGRDYFYYVQAYDKIRREMRRIGPAKRIHARASALSPSAQP
ncbi:hypothetical protein JXA32_01960 [Candidatus Sumerlaeota bacterium]|nr:hypothetical protein [Candidatus Sumerlaeota bacterium]